MLALMHVHPHGQAPGTGRAVPAPDEDQEAQMAHAYNGMPATELAGVTWRKSRRSNSSGNCVEMAKLSDGQVAVRNSRFPEGPALVYTHAEIEALVLGAKDGDFDHLLG
jgi:hypothetical protein